MNNFEKIKNTLLKDPNSAVKWLESFCGEDVKWKHAANNNQLIVRTDNYYYKIYAYNEVDKFNSLIRYAFADVYQSYGIKWDIITVKTEKGFLDIERREILDVCKDWSDEILLNYSKTLELVEEKLNFKSILEEIKKSYKHVSRLKLIRHCVNKPIDYAMYNNKIILLDDADWYISMLDFDLKPINMHNIFVKVKMFDEEYTFTSFIINPRRSVTIEKVYELSNKFFLFKNLDLIKREAALRQNFQTMLMDNISLLAKAEKNTYTEEKEMLCSPFKKIFYFNGDKSKIESIDFESFNKIAVDHNDILLDRAIWDNVCYQYVSQNICAIHLYTSLYETIDNLCDLLDQSKLYSLDPIDGYKNTGVNLYIQWNILNNNKKWEENFNYIKLHYPNVNIIINVILNEPFLQKAINEEIDIYTFLNKYGAIVRYGGNDNTDKEFWPKRSSMLTFFDLYSHDIEIYLKIFKTEYRFENNLNGCKHHNKNMYLPYKDSNKCCICDWLVVGNMI